MTLACLLGREDRGSHGTHRPGEAKGQGRDARPFGPWKGRRIGESLQQVRRCGFLSSPGSGGGQRLLWPWPSPPLGPGNSMIRAAAGGARKVLAVLESGASLPAGPGLSSPSTFPQIPVNELWPPPYACSLESSLILTGERSRVCYKECHVDAGNTVNRSGSLRQSHTLWCPLCPHQEDIKIYFLQGPPGRHGL